MQILEAKYKILSNFVCNSGEKAYNLTLLSISPLSASPHTHTHTHTHTHITETPGIAYIFQRKAKLFYMHFVLFNNDLQDLLSGSKYLRATVTENNSRLI